MRITRIDSLHADGGWRPFSFLKISTDEGLVGWSEYSQGPWAPALPAVIQALGERLIGRDPRAFTQLDAELQAVVRFAPGGLNQQAIAALGNACLDLAAKAAGVSVATLFGGPIRRALPLYWSHCGSFRARDTAFFRDVLGLPPLASLDDMKRLGEEVRARGFKAAKTNPIVFTPDGPRLLNPGFVPQGLDLGRNLDDATLGAIEDQVSAFRDGAGGDVALMLDLNFGFAAEGFARLGRRLERFNLKWLEMDVQDPAALASIRAVAAGPIASLESIYGRRGYKPFFDAQAVDVVVVDVPWNGLLEAVKVANLAETYELNVAPHNFYGPLADLMSAHFCAAVPNLDIMEIEADDVPWKYDLLTTAPFIAEGAFFLPDGVGWGTDINEQAVADHPWRGPPSTGAA
jgi:galactonate dehydratase